MTGADAPAGPPVREFLEAAVGGDPERARRTGLQHADRVGVVATVEGLLAPALHRAGELWLDTVLPHHGEHRVTAAVDAVVDDLDARVPHPVDGPQVVVSTGDDDWHGTGARLAGLLLRAAGWRARFVGPALSAGRLGDLLRAGDVDVVALSCASPARIAGVGRSTLAAHAHGVPVVVGGSAFEGHPGRVERVGADAGPGTLPGTGEELREWLDVLARQGLAVPAPSAHAAFELDPAALFSAVLDGLPAHGPFASRATQEDVVRTTVDTWLSAVALDDPALLADQLAWVRAYLEARSLPEVALRELAGALGRQVPIDPGGQLARAAHG